MFCDYRCRPRCRCHCCRGDAVVVHFVNVVFDVVVVIYVSVDVVVVAVCSVINIVAIVVVTVIAAVGILIFATLRSSLLPSPSFGSWSIYLLLLLLLLWVS